MTREPPAWPWFLTWLVVGAGYCLAVVGAATVGPLALVITAVATIVLARHKSSLVGLPGLVSGLSLPLLYVAYLNRAGPGTVCTTYGAGGQGCAEEWNPWSWLVVGSLLLLGGAVVFVLRHRHAHLMRHVGDAGGNRTNVGT